MVVSFIKILFMSSVSVAEEEKKSGTFSPQIDAHACHGMLEAKLDGFAQICTDVECSTSANAVSSRDVVIQEVDAPEIKSNENFKQISKMDLLCVSCKQLLFSPVVLNCGHGTSFFFSEKMLLPIHSVVFERRIELSRHSNLGAFFSILQVLSH